MHHNHSHHNRQHLIHTKPRYDTIIRNVQSNYITSVAVIWAHEFTSQSKASCYLISILGHPHDESSGTGYEAIFNFNFEIGTSL